MNTPVLHVLAGPNGSGKTTFVRAVLAPATHLPFINADEIATGRWPGQEEQHAYAASAAAAAARADALAARRSFITETVFSHPSKVELVLQARRAGYLVELHVMLMPEDATVARVAHRVRNGGHTVPGPKIRERYARLWALIRDAVPATDRATFYDNSRAATPFVTVATFERGRRSGPASWPAWTPAEIAAL